MVSSGLTTFCTTNQESRKDGRGLLGGRRGHGDGVATPPSSTYDKGCYHTSDSDRQGREVKTPFRGRARPLSRGDSQPGRGRIWRVSVLTDRSRVSSTCPGVGYAVALRVLPANRRAYRARCCCLGLDDGAGTVFRTSVVTAPLASRRWSAACIAAEPATMGLRVLGGSVTVAGSSGFSSGIIVGAGSGGFG